MRAAAFAAAALCGLAAHAGPAPVPAPAQVHARGRVPAAWHADQVFAQAGAARDAQALVVGATWHWHWQRPLWGGVLTGYWEASFGRWNSELDDGARSSAWVTQIGMTPVLRWHPGGKGRGWFLEGGIGANALLPIYRSRDKRFSTTFNFGDHIALGWPVGRDGSQELMLRIQHFSNAGIRHPNPGEDFVQLRFSWRM